MRNRLSLIAFVAAVVGCVVPPPASTPQTADSVRGIVSITGTSFQKRIALRASEGVIALALSASDSAALTQLGGVEVQVEGSRTSGGFLVDRFQAVSVEGRPVVDGIIRADNGQLFLEHDGKRSLIANPPTVLRTMVGARVWIGGPLPSGPNTFGMITPPKS